MLQRIAYGLLFISMLFTLIAADAMIARSTDLGTGWFGELISRGSLIPLACAAVAVLACAELGTLLARAGISPHQRWAYVCCVVLVLAPWLSAAGILGLGPVAREAVHLQLSLVILAFLGTGVAQFARRDSGDGLASATADLAGTWLLIVYAGLLPSFLVLLRCDVDVPGRYGPWVVMVFLAICKSSDIGAYFVGSAIGRHKLAPRISPGKTVEGALGGLATACAVSLFFLLAHLATMPNEDPLGGTPADDRARLIWEMTLLFDGRAYAQVLLFAAVIAVCGQMGDLIESVFKRAAQAKDSSGAVPAFGGILDMVDSPLAAAPVAWFVVTRLWNVV